MFENLFLLTLAMSALSGAFVIGFILQLLFVRVTKGKAAAIEFFKREF